LQNTHAEWSKPHISSAAIFLPHNLINADAPYILISPDDRLAVFTLSPLKTLFQKLYKQLNRGLLIFSNQTLKKA
jgi:hypothetical protein